MRLYGSSRFDNITSTNEDGFVSVHAGQTLLCSFQVCTLLAADVLEVQITVYSLRADCEAALVHHVKEAINEQAQGVEGAVSVTFEVEPDVTITASKNMTLSQVLQNKLKEQYVCAAD
jgi:hypothetical protein